MYFYNHLQYPFTTQNLNTTSILAAWIFPLKRKEKKKAREKNKQQELVVENLSLKITDSEYTGFGFEILQGSSPLIIQPHIPAIQGMKGFDTKEQAAIIGNYMIYKINNGIMPPSISVQDLDSLKIVY